MPRVLVIHYEVAEASILASRLRREDFEAEVYTARGAAGFRSIRASPPDAIVIDLSRMPSYGRAIGALLREQKSTRGIPLVFLEGDPAKTPLLRHVLPDAVVTNVLRIGPVLRKAILHPPLEPAVPDPTRLPLTGKLRIKEGSTVALRHAPEDFLTKLGPPPEGARFNCRPAYADSVILFVKSVASLGRELPSLASGMRRGRTIWVMWPKKSSGVASDLTSVKIVEMCCAFGLSGYKTCAVDDTWSAMAVALPGRGHS
jgi:CheY-like chemotaxis protein